MIAAFIIAIGLPLALFAIMSRINPREPYDPWYPNHHDHGDPNNIA